MPKERSEKSKYPSRYSPGGWVTPAQYIIELVCEQNARFHNKDLPMKFWNLDEWASFFKAQLRVTHKLLKKYDEKVIIKVIKQKKIRTLIPKWIIKVLDQEQKEYDAKVALAKKEKEERQPVKERIIEVPKRRTARLGGSALDKLLALDIEEKENGEDKEED